MTTLYEEIERLVRLLREIDEEVWDRTHFDVTVATNQELNILSDIFDNLSEIQSTSDIITHISEGSISFYRSLHLKIGKEELAFSYDERGYIRISKSESGCAISLKLAISYLHELLEQLDEE